MSLKKIIERQAVLAYFVLVYVIAWGSVLLIVQAFASSDAAATGHFMLTEKRRPSCVS